MRSKAWGKRHTNKKARRVLGRSDWVHGKVSGRRLNRANWGCGLAKKNVNPKMSESWNDDLTSIEKSV